MKINPIRRVKEWKDSIQNDILLNAERAVSLEADLSLALARITALDADHDRKHRQNHKALLTRIASIEAVLLTSQSSVKNAFQQILELKSQHEIHEQETQNILEASLASLAERHQTDFAALAEIGAATLASQTAMAERHQADLAAATAKLAELTATTLASQAAMAERHQTDFAATSTKLMELEATTLASQAAVAERHQIDFAATSTKLVELEATALASQAAVAERRTADLEAAAREIATLDTALQASQAALADVNQKMALLESAQEVQRQESQITAESRFAIMTAQYKGDLEFATQRIASLETVILTSQASLSESDRRIAELAAILTDAGIHKGIEGAELLRLNSTVASLSSDQTGLAQSRAVASELRVHRFEGLLRGALPGLDTSELMLLMAQRADEVVFLPVSQTEAQQRGLGGSHPLAIIAAISRGEVTKGRVILLTDQQAPPDASEKLVAAIGAEPVGAYEWLQRRSPLPIEPGTLPEKEFDRLTAVLARPDLIDFYAHGDGEPNRPFDKPDDLPRYTFAEPRRRSVLFAHHCYYNFYYLAKALRARGWDAICLSTDAPDSAHRKFYHGEDLTIHHPDMETQNDLLRDFFKGAVERFGMIHTYGKGMLSLFGSNYDTGPSSSKIPWDFIEAKRRGILLGYSHSGCLDGVTQSQFRAWNKTMCETCIWEDQPNICSDAGNATWGRKLTSVVDLFCTETDPPLGFKGSPNAFRAPLTLALDPGVWDPALKTPARLRRERTEDEIVVYHAVGNYALRSRNGRNVKGTHAVLKAVEALKQEGIKISLDFVENIPSIDNRFVQRQADIIVDQLHYGRYGALAREGMMLGKPVVGCVNAWDGPDLPATQCILDTPVVHATEESITAVMRDLALNAKKRQAIGLKSREHALHWWSADRLAERFEKVHDHLRDHGRPPAEADVS
jgi:hypothetical protein